MIWHPTPIRTLAMPRRSLLTASQRQALLALPTGEEDLERYWSLSDDDLAVIRRRRRPPNRQLTGPLDARQTARLEALLALHAGANINALAWVRQPEGVAYRSFALLIERLEHLRSIGLDPNLTASVHPERGRQLYESGVRLSAQHLRTLRPVKRREILVATVIEATVTLSDAAASMFERLVGKLFHRAETQEQNAVKRDRRTINAKVRPPRLPGEALIAARADGGDPMAAVEAVIGWDGTSWMAKRRAQGEVRASGGRSRCPRRARPIANRPGAAAGTAPGGMRVRPPPPAPA